MDSKLYENAPYIVGGAVGLISAAVILKKLINRPKVYNDPPDTVILCAIPRGPAAPSVSPFSLKLETYLRVAKIPHKTVFDRGMSPKGKTPYIMLNGETISDSQICIEYLNKKFNVDLDKHLTAEQKAIARALRKMTEDAFAWAFAVERWIYWDKEALADLCLPRGIIISCLLRIVSRNVKKAAYSQGIGRHTKEEIREQGLGDLEALSVFLGDKQYFMGDKISEVDCCLFGFLSQCKWHSNGTIYQEAVDEYHPKLEEYLLRVREEIWPDWADCISHGGYKPAIK